MESQTAQSEISYDDIRPYKDEELPHVISKLLEEPAMKEMIITYFPQLPLEPFMEKLRSLKNVKEFQSGIIATIVELIINNTTDGLTFDGLNNLEKGKSYLFISNHRDIVLDSAFINYLLNREGFETARIAIGINLLSKDWITHLVKLNKSFVVKRDLPRNEMYEASMQLSSYINKSIQQDGASVWIAQREGRSKDGDDRTQGGLINMLGMCDKNDLPQHFENLRIVPVSISYEFDPCDAMKLPELYARSQGEKYEKSPDEDYNSMKMGIQGHNGRVHISFGTPLSSPSPKNEDFNKAEVIQNITNAIDQQIHKNYKLWPSNFIAADLLDLDRSFNHRYTNAQLENFLGRMKMATSDVSGNAEELEKLFLKIYANPVINSLSD